MTDLAIGIPGRDFAINNAGNVIQDAGAVLVLIGARNVGLTFGGSKFFSELNFTGSVGTADRFGSVLAAKDFDGDGRDDLAMGVPLKDLRQLADAGAVFVQYSDKGPLVGNQQFWEQNTIFGSTPNPLFGSPTRAGSQFGFSLAAGDFNGDGRADLAIGAPFETIFVQNGNVPVENAGEVDVIYGSESGLSITAHAPQAWRESMPNSASQAASGDRFGQSLSAWNFGRNQFRLVGSPPHFTAVQTADLAIGIPFKNVGNILEAGAVQVIYGSFPIDPFSADGLTSANNQFWTQSGTGVLGPSQAGDHFGLVEY